MVITIDENRIYGYINYLGDYLYIDREGRVIDVKGETEESLPVIEGLNSTHLPLEKSCGLKTRTRLRPPS